jgi:predicted phage-related endonuclease
MVVYDDVVMLVMTGLHDGAMVVYDFMIADVAMLVMGEIRSLRCHTGEAKNNM